MLIGRIGEFGLIRRFREKLKTDSSVIVGSGDDCAVLKFNSRMYQLFTCDMIVEGVDFTSRDDPYLVGRKALAVSVSDIAACAGRPNHAVVSLGLPRNLTIKKVDKIADGIFDLARKYGINIVGGDISGALRLTIDVSMLGVVEKKNLCLRSTAKYRDIIFVSGPLGGSIKVPGPAFQDKLHD
jgi:thiamine-monophosphate kinase